MRSSIVLSLALLATAAPSIAAPISSGPYASPVLKREAGQELLSRSLNQEFARELFVRADGDDSGAFGWTSLIGPAISVIGSLFGNNNNKREFEELFTRKLQEEFARELMTRADGDDSGAFGWTSLIGPAISVIGSLFNNNKREFEEVLTRAFHEEFSRELMARADGDDSEAFGWTSLIGPAISAIGSLFGNHNNKREFEEFFTRALQEEFARELMARADGDESDAFGWTSLIGPAINLFSGLFSGNKREFEEVLTRAFHEEFSRELMARADGDESDAFGWTSLIGPAISVIGNLFGNHNNKREFEELFTRALQEEFARELMTRADGDESEAFGWTSLIGPAISAITSIFSNKREFETVARSLYDLD